MMTRGLRVGLGVLAVGLGSGLFDAVFAANGADAESWERAFAEPPVSARPLGWWHWINGNVTREGIEADLREFKRRGLGGVQMFDVEIYLPPGPVRYGTDNWHEHVQFAIRTAAELGLEFHLMNTPGWSASGGPWVTPERSMKKVVFSELNVAGGELAVSVPRVALKPAHGDRSVKHDEFYRDIAVLAVPRTTDRVTDLDGKIGWKARPVVRDTMQRVGVSREQVIDLTARMSPAGELRATLPPGEWTILRFGYTTTEATNHPAVPEGFGLEIDKLDADAVAFQFEQSMGRIIREAGPLAGSTLSGLLFDSFEGGFQNWTDSLPAQFRAAKGYDLIPWLPVLAGRVIDSAAVTEAVLWDFRDVIEEMIAENYYGTMARLAAAHGMRVYSESQGGPINPMTANRHVDVPMNEFWTPTVGARASRIKQSVSAAAFFGRSVVAAESFTSTPEFGRFQNTPATLKGVGDEAFALGINRYCLHSLTHQPFTELAPGFALGRYGAHFGRLNTWWPYADAWFSYISRCQFLLQQGHVVADICYLIDEDLGYGLPSSIAEASAGYDYLAAIPSYLREMFVREGRWVHPQAGSFRVLAVPGAKIAKAWVAQIDTLRHLREMIRAGGVLAGDPPDAPAGLRDWEQRDEFARLVREIWGDADARGRRDVGAGRVYRGMSVAEVMEAEQVVRDVSWDGPSDALAYIHRSAPGGEIYFLANRSGEARRVRVTFRETMRRPELWDAQTGRHRDAPAFRRNENGIEVTLDFEPSGSRFVVFREPLPVRWCTEVDGATIGADGGVTADATAVTTSNSDGTRRTVALAPLPEPLTVSGPWEVAFVDGRGAPERTTFERLESWSESANPGIRFYSGTVVYRRSIELPSTAPNQSVWLDLGDVADIARVFVNGAEAGVAWKAPFAVEITSLVHEGANQLEVHVANRWINRVVGDEAIDDGLKYQPVGTNKFTDGRLLEMPPWVYDASLRNTRRRQGFCTWRHYTADSPLVPSGLLGPVRVEWRNRIPAGAE